MEIDAIIIPKCDFCEVQLGCVHSGAAIVLDGNPDFVIGTKYATGLCENITGETGTQTDGTQ